MLIWLSPCTYSEETTPIKIVSLAPHITELLFEIGAGHMIVATVNYANYPEAAKTIPRIGDYNSVRIESVLMLQPTFVVAQPGTALEPYLLKLKKLGVDVRYSHPENAQQVAEHLLKLGRWTGQGEEAKRVADQFLSDWQTLRQTYNHRNISKQPLKVFFQAWLNPLMTLNRNNLIHEVIELCGGRNVFAELPMQVPQVSVEAVINANPDVIIYSGETPMDDTPQHWASWQGITAVRDNKIFWVHSDDLARPVPGILKGARKLCQLMHPASS